MLTLLQQTIFITSIDLDNASYAIGAIQRLKPQQQQIAIFWSTFLELMGRLLLIAIFVILTGEEKPLFTFGGVAFTVENISLFAAGTFLLVRNGRGLIDFFRTRGEPEEFQPTKADRFRKVIFEMGVMLTVMSIDTVLAGLGIADSLIILLFLLLFSAAVRLLFVRHIATFVQRYPAINIVILTLLTLIGAELILQGFGLDFEPLFNAILIASLIVAIMYHRQRANSPLSTET